MFHHISNTEKRVENATRSGLFLTKFEVFDIVMKHCDETECLIIMVMKPDKFLCYMFLLAFLALTMHRRQ